MKELNKQRPKDGAQRKRDHDRRKREAGLKEFRAWVTPEQAKKLADYLSALRSEISDE